MLVASTAFRAALHGFLVFRSPQDSSREVPPGGRNGANWSILDIFIIANTAEAMAGVTLQLSLRIDLRTQITTDSYAELDVDLLYSICLDISIATIDRRTEPCQTAST